MAKHMSAYRSYIEVQRMISSKALDVKILSRAFSQLSNLEILHVDFWDTTIGASELIHAFGAFKAENLLTCDCCHTLPVLVQALAASRIKIKVFKLGGDEDSSYSSISGFDEDYSTAASLARPNLATSITESSCPARISTQALSKTFCDENFEIYKNALGNLRELEVGVIIVEGGDPANMSRIIAALRNMIHCAWRLETVTLEGICSLFLDDLPRSTMDMVMPYSSHGFSGWNNLKGLTIHRYEANVASLIDFFRRHGNTIVKVGFNFVAITGSDWSAALMQLRTICFPRLEIFILNYCDEEEADLQVQDYILKKTNEDPIVEEKKRLEREREREEAEQQQQAAAIATA